ncbi:hypothetical protein NC653_038715 [Populus alba x Populus x berolinensis]|uniref:Uncharacterized protein n=1 Tax=Populus alba x Populus x berolinensis TaxID=444605 RepID=A0AAD6LHW4_9ROSI|nr:hypothetical protein NC653_038715 [Populus alba x Populus x berolinensis]
MNLSRGCECGQENGELSSREVKNSKIENLIEDECGRHQCLVEWQDFHGKRVSGSLEAHLPPVKEEQKKQEGQMSKDEDQVKKDENAFAELNKSNQANIDPCLALTAPEDDRNACVLV